MPTNIEPRRPRRRLITFDRVIYAGIALASAAVVWHLFTTPVDEPAQPPTATAAGPALLESGYPLTADSAKAFVLAYADLKKAGRAAEAWERLAPDARAAMSQDDYARVYAVCQTPSDILPREITNAVLTRNGVPVTTGTPDGAIVTEVVAGLSSRTKLVTEDGQWRLALTAEKVAKLRGGPDKLIAEYRTNGWCE